MTYQLTDNLYKTFKILKKVNLMSLKDLYRCIQPSYDINSFLIELSNDGRFQENLGYWSLIEQEEKMSSALIEALVKEAYIHKCFTSIQISKYIFDKIQKEVSNNEIQSICIKLKIPLVCVLKIEELYGLVKTALDSGCESISEIKEYLLINTCKEISSEDIIYCFDKYQMELPIRSKELSLVIKQLLEKNNYKYFYQFINYFKENDFKVSLQDIYLCCRTNFLPEDIKKSIKEIIKKNKDYFSIKKNIKSKYCIEILDVDIHKSLKELKMKSDLTADDTEVKRKEILKEEFDDIYSLDKFLQKKTENNKSDEEDNDFLNLVLSKMGKNNDTL